MSALPDPAGTPLAVAAPPVGTGRTRSAWTALRSNRFALVGAALALLLVLIALLAPVIAPFPDDAGSATHPEIALAKPSGEHLLGTDQVGRDVLSRVLYGTRTSLRIAASVLILAVLIGVPLGLVAGYVGGWLDDVIMRITDIFLAFPALLLSLALAAVLSPSVGNATLAIAATWWPWYARLARGSAVAIRDRGYVEAARALGVSRRRILARHVLPNATTPVLVQASLDVGGIIITAAALSFLGLGAQDPTAEWGLMVSQGQALLATNWWFPVAPGVAIVIMALAFNLLGDGLRTVLDPRKVAAR
ncbi:MAG TPA: ABC transporter permease [Solirubrobacteraceae bacterium]|nr:ABC transporter permease [Solirubrobacteraceae bacterium]